jgi:hypothetical protein
MDTFLIAVVVVLSAALAPIGGIWALNTLFGLGIAYTFKTWLAALILGAILNPVVNVKKN